MTTSVTPQRIQAIRDEHGWSAFKIAKYLGVSLTEVRRALDPHAEALHGVWNRKAA